MSKDSLKDSVLGNQDSLNWRLRFPVRVRLVSSPVVPSFQHQTGHLSDCACMTDPGTPAASSSDLEFANRVEELRWLAKVEDNPDLKVIDAPAGYGKTRLIEQLAERRRNEQWLPAIVDLAACKASIDVMARIHEAIIGKPLATGKVREAETELLATLALQSKLLICFDNAEKNRQLTQWIYEVLIPKLKGSLKNNVELQIVIAGRGMSRLEMKWSGYQVRGLSQFEWSDVRDMLVKSGKTAPVPSHWKENDYRELALATTRLSGGHPGMITYLINEIIDSKWTLSFQDRAAQDHVGQIESTLKEMLDDYDLTNEQIETLSALSIFRGVSADTLRGLMDWKIIKSTDAVRALGQFTSVGILRTPQQSLFACDAIIRGLLLSQMQARDNGKFIYLNQVARELYHKWLQITLGPNVLNREALTRIYLIESVYHALQLRNHESIVDEIRGLRAYAEERDIQAWLNGDDDVKLCIREFLNKSVDKICKEAFSPILVTGNGPTSRANCLSQILEVESAEGKGIGTAFLLAFQGRPYVVTCAHVLRAVCEQPGQTIKLKYSDKPGYLLATVRRLTSFGSDADNGYAEQDVAVLDVEGEIAADTELVLMNDSRAEDMIGRRDCFTFAFIATRTTYGAWINQISCDSKVARGFLQVSQQESKKVPFEQGLSGAPLFGDALAQRTIIGMFSAIRGTDTAYLIPSDIILSVLNSIGNPGGTNG